MHSLSEFRDFLVSKQIEIKTFNGWQLTTKDGDIWTLSDGVFYLNGTPRSLVDKEFFKYYKGDYNDIKSNKTRKWRGISCRRNRGK